MNKRSTRSFAYGVLFTTTMIGMAYLYLDSNDKREEPLTLEEAIAFVESEDYIVVSEEDFSGLTAEGNQDRTDQPEKEAPIDFTLEIGDGMTPAHVGPILEENELVIDGSEFTIYLDEHGYSKKLQKGTFQLHSDMSYREIARIITNS